MVVNQGDIYWVSLEKPGGPKPDYLHPHVIIQDNVINHSRLKTVVVCALTTNLKRSKAPGNVLLEAGEANLPKQSIVVVSQVSSVDKAQLGEYIGSLNEQRISQILAGMRFLQHLINHPETDERVMGRVRKTTTFDSDSSRSSKGAKNMIARVWKGWTKAENADAYEKLLREVVYPGLRNINGYHGGYIFRQDGKQETEFVTVNLFESLDAVKAFAGSDYEVPVFEPEARRLLSRVEPIARHYDVKHTPE